MFLADHNPCHLNTSLSSSSGHFSEEKVIMIDDQDLISREQEGDQSSSKGTIMVEQKAAIDVKLFPKHQHVSNISFNDPVEAFMELYLLKNLKVLDFFSLHMISGEYDFLKKFLSVLSHFKHHLLISDKDEIISILKLR